MNSKFALLLLICLLSSCTSAPITTPPAAPTNVPLSGSWLGAVTALDNSTQSILIDLTSPQAELNVEPRTKMWPLTLTQTGQDVHFTAEGNSTDPFSRIEFTGTFVDNTFAGEFNWDGKTSQVELTPIATIAPSILSKYEGVYRFESGRALSIILGPSYNSSGLEFFHDGLTMTDFESGDLRGLYALEDFTFAVGALRVVGAPLDGRIQFIVDDLGNAEGLMWWDKFDEITPSADSGQYAERVPFSFEDITYSSADGIKLAGRFIFPESTQPLPAFVSLHGSEPGTKDNFGQKLLSDYMVSQGFAILTADKRGVGASEGVYHELPSQSNLDLLSDDTIAGVEYLLTRPEVDAQRIGLIGSSQAGWIIPLAASRSDHISFFVNLSGPVVSTSQEDVYSNATNDGDTLTKFDPAKLDQQVRDLSPSGVDPVPVIAKLDQPGLWLWGSVDKSLPVAVSAENLQALIDSGKKNFSYEIFPNADHNLNISPQGLFNEIPFSPGEVYFAALTDWLKENTTK